MSSNDLSQRFIFETTDIRGEVVKLESSYQTALTAHHYPPAICELLGELSACAVLLSATLKFEGSMTLQARSNGPVSLLMVEIDQHRQFRALARYQQEPVETDLHQLLPDGQLVITVDPDKGKRYQGIVPFDGTNLAECFDHYFSQSEQLPTRLWLHADAHQAFGLLLQALPGDKQQSPELATEDWSRLVQLASTLRHDEAIELEPQEVLHRLYHEEEVRLFDTNPVTFHCNCSRKRTGQALYGLGEQEARGLLEQQHSIDMDCQFCNTRYQFSAADVDELFRNPPATRLH